MNLSTPSDRMLQTTCQPHRVDDHVGDEAHQIESAIEPIVEGAEVKLGVVAELEGLLCSTNSLIDIPGWNWTLLIGIAPTPWGSGVRLRGQ